MRSSARPGTVLSLSRLRAGAKPMNRNFLTFKRRGVVFVLTALAAVLFLGVALSLLPFDKASDIPVSGESPKTGSARDMLVHHSQAVETAETLRGKTESQQIGLLAANIPLNQQAELGQIQGWLDASGSPATGDKSSMSWTGMPTEGRRPGMASPDGTSKLFLWLMISYHRAAIPMAEDVLERTDRPEFRQLAQAISASQREEISYMQDVLQSIGSEPPAGPKLSVESEPNHASYPAHGVSPIRQETAAGIAHGAALGAVTFLVGLVAFVALVWLPVTRVVGAGSEVTGLFVRCAWALFGLLAVSGVAELSLYAVRASGEPFSLGLLGEATFEARVGHVWLERVCLGLLTAAAMTWAARRPRPPYRWWLAAGVGGTLLATLTQLSHAAAEEGLLPLLADWLHVAAASVWMGGLLGFPLVLLGPLRAMAAEQRAGLLRVRAVRRFSRIAILAVTIVVLTGAYATLLHLPDFSALIGTPYGRALLIKLGMLVLVLATGGINLMLEGREPFERLIWIELILALGIFVATGVLTSLPPPADI